MNAEEVYLVFSLVIVGLGLIGLGLIPKSGKGK